MKSTRTQRTSDFKAKVALAVVRSTATIPELGMRFGVERDFFPGGSGVWAGGAARDDRLQAARSAPRKRAPGRAGPAAISPVVAGGVDRCSEGALSAPPRVVPDVAGAAAVARGRARCPRLALRRAFERRELDSAFGGLDARPFLSRNAS